MAVTRITSVLRTTKRTASSLGKTRSQTATTARSQLRDEATDPRQNDASDAVLDGMAPRIKEEILPVALGNGPGTPNGLAMPVKPEILTADGWLDAAMEHLISVDPRLARVIDQFPCRMYSPSGLAERVDPFAKLVSGILSQQISGHAARAVTNRFILLFNDDHTFPSPQQVVGSDVTTLKSAGLSGRKAEYVLDLAQKFIDGTLSEELLSQGTDEEIIARLVSVRGIGEWSAEMFLMFCLKRPDIISYGDLGIQRGMALLAGKNVANLRNKKGKWKYMSQQEMQAIGDAYRPYRSLFCWYCWRVDGALVALDESVKPESDHVMETSYL